MALTEITVRPVVGQWSTNAAPVWSNVEVDEVVAAILALSAVVSPHLVPDVPLSPDRLQHYLLARTIGQVEDFLVRAAAAIRRMLGIDAPQLTETGDARAIGLRSATLNELESLPGVGAARALDIARTVALQSAVSDHDDLQAIDGVGPHTVDQIRGVTFFDRPRVGFVSNSAFEFAQAPSIPAFIRLLDSSDVELFFGDGNALRRRGIRGGTPVERLLALIELAREFASHTQSVASGIMGSEAERWGERHDRRQEYLNNLAPADGTLLINASYVAAAKALIEAAQSDVRLMVFLGTVAAGDDLAPGPLELVEAMEAKATSGVPVRVILDQDDGGEPYGSFFINQPLVDRFAASEVVVKFDEKDTLLHSKVLVVDNSAVIVGSHNWTKAGFNNTHEVSVLIESEQVASAYAARFQHLWDELP